MELDSLDSLAAGFTLTNGDGTTNLALPSGSSYKIVGALGAGSSTTVQLQFTRVGAPALTYNARVMEGTVR